MKDAERKARQDQRRYDAARIVGAAFDFGADVPEPVEPDSPTRSLEEGFLRKSEVRRLGCKATLMRSLGLWRK
jgi:hypothetical protein